MQAEQDVMLGEAQDSLQQMVCPPLLLPSNFSVCVESALDKNDYIVAVPLMQSIMY